LALNAKKKDKAQTKFFCNTRVRIFFEFDSSLLLEYCWGGFGKSKSTVLLQQETDAGDWFRATNHYSWI